MLTRREAAALGAAAAMLGGDRASAQQPGFKPADFFAAKTTADVALSPSGDRIAVLGCETRAKGVFSYIDIFDARDPAKPAQRVPLGAHEGAQVEWANETRLLIWVIFEIRIRNRPVQYIRRVIALSDDGSKPVVLFGNRNASLVYVYDLGTMIDTLPDEPDWVLMSAFDAHHNAPTLYRVNVNTGQSVVLEYGELRTGFWFTQNGVPMVRLDGTPGGSVTRVMARAPGEQSWKLVRKIRREQTPDLFVSAAAEEPGVFFVGARLEGEDTLTMRTLDLRTLAFGPPLARPAGVDASGAWVGQDRKLIATTHRTDRLTYEFADKGFDAHYSALGRYFGEEANVRLITVDKTATRYLGMATGPRNPGTYFAYDKSSRAVRELGAVRPALTAARLGTMEIVPVRTRDGQTIRAYLTGPASRTPGPLVIVPHGGPEVRDVYDFDTQAQLLAAQGWWVLQPNFRGSGGYGLAFAQAGWKRWGERMQEDVEDAVAQVVASHRLDSARVGILGASYGGYAALMGAVRQPDLYKAVVAISGPSDLPEMMAWERKTDTSEDDEAYNFWLKRIGDPVKDRAMLQAASPALRAGEIKAPVLLAHGVEDGIVPVGQSRIMAAALKAAGRPYDYLEVKAVGHGWPEAEQLALIDRYIAFLAKAFA